MISVLAAAEHDGERLSDDEILAFCRLLLPAGAETTYRSSSNLLSGLLTHPEQLDAVRADRSLLPQAIEEGLRWEPPLLMIIRTATRGHRGVRRADPEGRGVIINMGSANHDEQPLGRRRALRHPPRPAGPHRLRLRAPHVPRHAPRPHGDQGRASNRLLDRLPDLRADPAADPPAITGMTFRAPPRLDVVFDVGWTSIRRCWPR